MHRIVTVMKMSLVLSEAVYSDLSAKMSSAGPRSGHSASYRGMNKDFMDKSRAHHSERRAAKIRKPIGRDHDHRRW